MEEDLMNPNGYHYDDHVLMWSEGPAVWDDIQYDIPQGWFWVHVEDGPAVGPFTDKTSAYEWAGKFI